MKTLKKKKKNLAGSLTLSAMKEFTVEHWGKSGAHLQTVSIKYIDYLESRKDHRNKNLIKYECADYFVVVLSLTHTRVIWKKGISTEKKNASLCRKNVLVGHFLD